MKRSLAVIAAFGLIAHANAQLWDGSALPPSFETTFAISPAVDGYFTPGGGGLSEFDMDSGFDFSLAEGGTKPIGITEAGGWFDASTFAVGLDTGDVVRITYLGKTAGAINDFGLNFGGSNAYGAGAYTLWESITNTAPVFGEQFEFTWGSAPISIDFWLNSPPTVDPDRGGTYSIFDPSSSVPDNSGLPAFDYSARGRVFSVNDSISGDDRSILVIAIEDWRDFDADFTDMFFAIEIPRIGEPQFPVPEPSTYGLIGAMLLLGLIAVRRARR